MIFSLTPRQRACMIFIQEFIEKTGTGPSYREIASGIGIRSKSGVNSLVKSLVLRGYLEEMPSAKRSLTVRHHVHTEIKTRKPDVKKGVRNNPLKASNTKPRKGNKGVSK